MSEEILTKKEKRQIAKEEKRKGKERNKLIKKIKGIVLVVVIVGGLGFGGFSLIKWINTPTPVGESVSLEVNESDWTKGAEQALVTLVEYGDFQCPACASYSNLVKRLVEDFPNELRVIYRHYPLTSIHRNAIAAAKAAEAAGAQGKFWEMHDMLFERQDDWENESNVDKKLKEYAEELELDLEKYEQDFDSDSVKDRVDSQSLSAFQLGVSSTPSFFLNGKKIDSPRGYDAFKQLVEGEISDSQINQE